MKYIRALGYYTGQSIGLCLRFFGYQMGTLSELEFDFNQSTIISGATVSNLIKWIGELHSELTNAGVLPDTISSQTHNELMVFANLADGLD